MADRPERRGRKGRKKVCTFCVENIKEIDYKDVNRLRRYVSERAKTEDMSLREPRFCPAESPAHAPSTSVSSQWPSSAHVTSRSCPIPLTD